MGARLLHNLPILLVEIFTLLLLSYIGYAEVLRRYPQFQLDKMEAQVSIIRNAMDPTLQAGIPVEQFSGFNTYSSALQASDSFIVSIKIFGLDGQLRFESYGKNYSLSDEQSYGIVKKLGKDLEWRESENGFKVMAPLNGKLGVAGSIELVTHRDSVSVIVEKLFRSVFFLAIAVLVGFSIFTLGYAWLAERSAAWRLRQRSVISGGYLVSFVAISAIIGSAVFSAYEIGAREKTKALADTLSNRIDAVLELGVSLDDISGINDAFAKYKTDNPDISNVALSVADRSVFHTDGKQVGREYQSPSDSIEYRVPLRNDGVVMHLAVSIPKGVVREAVMSRTKEFIVLFLACGLMSWIFLDAGTGLVQRRQAIKSDDAIQQKEQASAMGLKLVKPAYFLIVFTSALPISFLPQLVTGMAEQTSGDFSSGTLPFTLYYLIFALVLIPAGRYAEKGNLKRMMFVGFVAEVIGLLLIAATSDYWLLTLGRAFSGFGQGVFLIGLNSYTLSITPQNKRTEGAAVKVNGRNAGLISGTAIGALLFAYMDYQEVFLVASCVSVIGAIYLWRLVPGIGEFVESARAPIRETTWVRDLLAVARDGEFMRTLLLVGVIGKIAVSGVVMFSIPLILSAQGFPPEEIGQALMIYYIASIVATKYSARMVDYLGANSKNVLFFSALVGGLGMMLLGLVGLDEKLSGTFPSILAPLSHLAVLLDGFFVGQGFGQSNTFLIIAGIVLAGTSNGLLAAPVMTHIDMTQVANSYGNKAVAATYLFLERGGHVVGPLVASYLLVIFGQSALGIAIFGLVSIILGGLFLLTSNSPGVRKNELALAQQ